MGTKKGIPYSFPFRCTGLLFKAALNGTNEKASDRSVNMAFKKGSNERKPLLEAFFRDPIWMETLTTKLYIFAITFPLGLKRIGLPEKGLEEGYDFLKQAF